MIPGWVEEEMQAADLRDKRLNKRLMHVLSYLSDRPTASIPAACGGHSETVAAYRFFDNPQVTCEKILAPHQRATRARMASQQVVVIASDTTELNLTRPRQQVEGVGPISSLAQRGAFLHLLHAFTVDGTPLGTVGARIWARDQEDFKRSQEEKRKRRKAAPLEEKESFRWLEGFRQARETAEALPNGQCVYVADSESDIYHLFVEPRGSSLHWLIRACQPRLACHDPAAESPTWRPIRQQVLSSPVLLTRTVTVRERQVAKIACETRVRRVPRQGRAAPVAVRAASITLRPPPNADRSLPPATVNAVLVREIDPPPDDPPVEWLLLTTLPIDTPQQVCQIIGYYTVRWMIEVLFRTLKSGCRVELRRFEHLDRLLPCVAIYLIVAWRTLMLVRLGRSCPKMDCEAVLDPAEWQSVWVAMHQQPPPTRPPSLEKMLRLIAQLGGYVNRPGRKDMPGPQTTWLGLQRMRDLAWAWNAFGPGAKSKTGFV